MNAEFQVGPSVNNDGVTRTGRSGRTGEQMVSDTHPRSYEAAYRGSIFSLAVSAGAPTAYVGAAAGTPLIALHNPTGSGKNLVLIGISIANRVAASAAGTVSFGLWGGASALPTGTQTSPLNMLSFATTGSVVKGFSNTVLTGSTALSLILSPATYYWATGAGAFAFNGYTDINGAILVIPGNQIAIGATSALTSATWDVSLIWEEIAI